LALVLRLVVEVPYATVELKAQKWQQDATVEAVVHTKHAHLQVQMEVEARTRSVLLQGAVQTVMPREQ